MVFPALPNRKESFVRQAREAGAAIQGRANPKRALKKRSITDVRKETHVCHTDWWRRGKASNKFGIKNVFLLCRMSRLVLAMCLSVWREGAV
jgi:hypothetical protein